MPAQIEIDRLRIEESCRKWKIREFALFGSVLRDDFGPESDIDVLVSYEPDAPWSLWDLVDMHEELQGIFGREVDLVDREGLKNPYRRRAILASKEVVYAA